MGTKQGYAITTWRLRLRCKHPEWLETTQNFYNEIQKFYYDLYLERPELWKEKFAECLCAGLETLSIPWTDPETGGISPSLGQCPAVFSSIRSPNAGDCNCNKAT